MNKPKWILVGLMAYTLSACSSLPSLSSITDVISGPKTSPNKRERVGVLLVQNCAQTPDCSKYSLLESGMRNRSTVLTGNIQSSRKGQLIAVLGEQMPAQNGLEVIKVEKVHPITAFDYQPFLTQSAAAYMQQTYGCQPLWDQSYAWRIDGRQPILITVLTHPVEAEKSVFLEYDGLTKTLASVDSIPEQLDPCTPR